MSNQFKAGDRVIANQTSKGNNITEGKEYAVLSVAYRGTFNDTLTIVDDRGEKAEVFSYRFKPTKPHGFASHSAGEQLKAAGQAKALKRAGSAWLDDALAALKVFVTEQYSVGETDITIDQFRRLERTYEPANPNAWGALPRAAIKAGYIKSTTRTEKAIRPKAQGRVVRVWDIVPDNL